MTQDREFLPDGSGLLAGYGPVERPLVRIANAITRRTFLHRVGTATIALSAAGLAAALDPEVARASYHPTCPCDCPTCANGEPPVYSGDLCTDCVSAGMPGPPETILCQCLTQSNACPNGTSPSPRAWYTCPAKECVQGIDNACSGYPFACSSQTLRSWARVYRDCCKASGICPDAPKPSCDDEEYWFCHTRGYCNSGYKNWCVAWGCSSCVVCHEAGSIC